MGQAHRAARIVPRAVAAALKETEAMWDSEYDFVSVGGGIGGLSGGITAAERGCRALVLESSPLVGGVSALSLGMLWVAGNHLEEAAGIDDDWRRGHDHVRWMTGGFGDDALSAAWCEAAPEAVRFFADAAGVRWRLFDQADYYYPQGAQSLATGRYLEVEPIDGAELGADQSISRKGGNASFALGERFGADKLADPASKTFADRRALGGGLAAYLLLACRRYDVDIRTEVRTHELVVKDGRVDGLVIEQDGRVERIRARRGVMLATSGYDRDLKMARLMDARLGHGTRVPPSVRGDHLRLAGMLGAQVLSSVVRPQWIGPGFRAGDETDAEGLEAWQAFSCRNPHSIMVNDKGERFCDETWGPSYVSALSHVDPNGPRLRNQPFWGIFDARYRGRYPVGSFGPRDELPLLVVEAPTLRALAERLGIDGTGLETAVAAFNVNAARGHDPDFGRGTRPQTLIYGDASVPSPVLGTVAEAPFYGVPLEAASIGIPTMGLACDGSSRVLDWNGRVIEGLYAAGNSVAMTDLGIGYNSGIANTRGMTFGYLAARDCC